MPEVLCPKIECEFNSYNFYDYQEIKEILFDSHKMYGLCLARNIYLIDEKFSLIHCKTFKQNKKMPTIIPFLKQENMCEEYDKGFCKVAYEQHCEKRCCIHCKYALEMKCCTVCRITAKYLNNIIK